MALAPEAESRIVRNNPNSAREAAEAHERAMQAWTCASGALRRRSGELDAMERARAERDALDAASAKASGSGARRL